MISLVIYFLLTTLLNGSAGTVRNTLNGRVQGFETESLPGQPVEQYLGIPYAQPPTGNLRFERPRDVENWLHDLNATELPPACPQSGADTSYIREHLKDFTRESEDCLYLNIYVPKVSTEKQKLPVFVWVHGGSNEVGMGAMLRGDILAARSKVIVINLNYRLDVLGFFSMENDDFSGNLGLFDQLKAFQWIHKNIEAFGGDPERITLAGHSAGALNVGVHILSPLSKGLFQFAVLQSGSAISFWSLITPAWRREYNKCAEEFLVELHCNFTDSKSVKHCLKQKSLEELQKADFRRVPGFPIRHPVIIDGYLLPEHPVELLKNNRSHVEAVLMGFTKDEGIYLLGYDAYYQSQMGQKMDLEFVHDFLSKGFYNLGPKADVALIVHEYVDWSNPIRGCPLVRSCAEMFADRGFSAPLHRTANYLTGHRPNSTYMYTFEFDLKEYTSLTDCGYWQGVPHGQDIFYLFGIPLIGHHRQTFIEGDKAMSNAFMDLWGSFIKTGKLEYNQSYPLEPYNTETKPYIRMFNSQTGDVAIEMAYNYKPRRMAFWNRLMVDRESYAEACNTSKSFMVQSDIRVILTLLGFLILDWT